ncbi:MAG: FHA domain-containing protein [Actinomycetota bacterium]|nr:FHA domain-containing protein [Actinomycetota bacterium]
MPDSLLTILKFCFLALLYLFFLRVLRAVWAEVSGRNVPAAVAAPVQARQGWSGQGKGGGNSKGGSRLKVIEPPETKGQIYELGDELTVGRAGGCQITLDDTYVSQLHARVFRREGQLYVEDLGSTNGSYLNRKKLTAPVAIRKGDRLQIGKTVMELQ